MSEPKSQQPVPIFQNKNGSWEWTFDCFLHECKTFSEDKLYWAWDRSLGTWVHYFR